MGGYTWERGGGFVDYETDLMEAVPGSFEATCP